MSIEHIVTHYTPLTERKGHIEREFLNHGISHYTFIEKHDKEILTEEQLSKFEKISPSEISLFYKHIEIFKMQVEKGFSGITCVYEDDAVLTDNFLENIQTCIDQLPEDWDMVFGGECADLHEWNREDGKIVYLRNTSRGTCFYMVNSKYLSIVVDYFDKSDKIRCAIDWWFNRLTRFNDSYKYYWTEPTLVKQGSELGWFKKSIEITLT
jgi:GR25 family glycosyltransferase involved in LPS biosynthesis